MDLRIDAKLFFALLLCGVPAVYGAADGSIVHNPERQHVIMSDAGGNLILRLNYSGGCSIDQVIVGGREVVGPNQGVYSGIKLNGTWFTSRGEGRRPQVSVTSDRITVTGIEFGGAGVEVAEAWHFTVSEESIAWQIEREYRSGGTLEDTCFPGWEFAGMSTWTGALIGHGGVAWSKLFDRPNATYGVQNGKLTFWNPGERRCLRMAAGSQSGHQVAVRFTREPDGAFSCGYSWSDRERGWKHGLSRFRRDRSDIWKAFDVAPGRVNAEYVLSAPAYDDAYDRGLLPSLDGRAIREMSHTIARIGAIDELIMGSNGYYSGFAVLHEPWLAQLGLAIQDPDYHRAFADTLDYQRQHAIGSDGRVKSRWAGQRGDEIPGTYDPLGFYECQWGWLMDSQTSWVINVAEQFDFTGDRSWLERQKSTTEQVLEFLLRRDTDGDGLVEMMTDSHRDAQGSDWIDVVWAAHENALVNAQLYWALLRWADLEELLGDREHAARYRDFAGKLKRRFNQTTDEGGFWDPKQQFYIYWRDKDNSLHGTNLVVPVNFSAIGYGLCDDPERRAAVLDRMEALMQKEGLFFWPLCFFSFAKEEGHPEVNWPFPSYENGDIFLAWGELGTRAYASHAPAVALRYVKNVLAQYQKDGLSFQRYLRRSQAGAGDDILANNCSVIVGLYRNIYGLQPKHDRLYLEPHIVPELDGTRFKYSLRGKEYQIELNTRNYAISVDGFTIRARQPFAVRTGDHKVEYFRDSTSASSLTITTTSAAALDLSIRAWPEPGAGDRAWTVSGLVPGVEGRQEVSDLAPGRMYKLSLNAGPVQSLRSDAAGRLSFAFTSGSGPQAFELTAE